MNAYSLSLYDQLFCKHKDVEIGNSPNDLKVTSQTYPVYAICWPLRPKF